MGSIHDVEIVNGEKITKKGKDKLFFESKEIQNPIFIGKCSSCDNDFISTEYLKKDGDVCLRCYERITELNRV